MNAPSTNLAVKVSQPLAEARSLKIATPDDYEKAGDMLKAIKSLRKEVDDAFDDIIKKAHDAHKAAVAKKREHEVPLTQAEALIKGGMIAYQSELQRKAREEQARLEEQARKERERLEARAAKAEAAGKSEKADELRSRAETVAAPVVSINTPKVAGIATRETYRAVVVDLQALVRGIVEGKVPVLAVMPDMTFLNGQARLQKDALNYPGVRVEKIQGISSRAS